jgi:sulfatase maturation enzyme AslB (radical SAM superfamily)
MGSLRENIEMTIGSIIRKAIRPQSKAYKDLQLLYRYLLSIKRAQKLKTFRFGVMLADHCNLNCAGCGAYSPVAKERFYDVDAFRNDCERIANLTGGKIASMGFAGGEPLLHPGITDCFDIARSFFARGGGGGGTNIGIK